MELDDLWIAMKVELLDSEGDIYRYRYTFNDMGFDDGGIIDIEEGAMVELVKSEDLSVFYDLMENERIGLVQTVKDENFWREGYDISFLIVIRYLRNKLIEDGVMPEYVEIINLESLEKLRDKFPDEIDEIMKDIDEDIKSRSS